MSSAAEIAKKRWDTRRARYGPKGQKPGSGHGGWTEKTHGHLRPMLSELGRQSRKHGQSGSPTYLTWLAMIKRCTDPRHMNFKHYGGRGITVDAHWLDYDSFLADMGERPADRTLDRIDNSAGYSKANCRWATHADQMRNRRCSVFYEVAGKRQTLGEWAKELGVPANGSGVARYRALLDYALALLNEKARKNV
jgi:hypothetical protein